MNIKICGMGVISSIGIGCNENLKSLIHMRHGLGQISLFDSAINVPVGELKMSNDELKHYLGIDVHSTVSRTALIGAIAAKEAINNASIPEGKRIGFISSTTVGGMDLSEQFFIDYLKDQNKGRLRNIAGHDCATSTEFIADYCNINGFQTTISTACSSAANAIIMGAEMLNMNMLDYVVVGGTDALCKFTLNGFNSLMILDKDLCKPLDRDRKGLNLGEGAGYLVLTNDKDCQKTYCMLKGYANANDAFHQTASSESGEGAFLAMKGALAMANLEKTEIDYINLHGTGTGNNDSSELAAVNRLFGNKTPECSSTKSFTGHILAAAAGVEAVFSALAIINGIKYASLRFGNSIGEGIKPLTKTVSNIEVRNVLSNSFGFGVNCSSLVFSK